MRKHIKVKALTLIFLMLAGCGQAAKSSIPDDSSYIPEDTLSVDENITVIGNDIIRDESMTESEMIRTAGDTNSSAGNIKEELPDYLKGDSDKGAASTPAAASEKAEGINIAAGDEITARANAESCTLGETYTIHTDTGDVDLTVHSVDVVKNTDPGIAAKKIARVSYSYTNVSANAGLIIDDIFFRLADDNGKALTVYVPDYTLDENQEPKILEKGESCDALIAFALYEDTEEMTLFFDDQTTGMKAAQELFWVVRES